MSLNQAQRKQIEKQLKVHQHQRYTNDIVLTEGYVLKNFTVLPKVMRPEKMTSLYLAKWLFFNNGLYKNKRVLDMGCGSGILGIVTALYGAKNTTLTDVDQSAVTNTGINIKKFKLTKKTKIFQGDLFERIKGKFDLIVFNHPFFGDLSKEYKNTSMINGGQLLHQFLKESKQHLNKRAVIIMPYYHLAGPANDPSKHAAKYGFIVKEKLALNVRTGLQQGPISIYELSR